MRDGSVFTAVMRSVHKFSYGHKFERSAATPVWPEALKREIVAATLVPGSSASVVARQYDVNVNQVFAWRKRFRAEAREPTDLRLMPVTVTPDQPIASAPVHVTDVIEIELSGGYRVRIGGGVKAAALRLVLDVLERR
jgi:transposase